MPSLCTAFTKILGSKESIKTALVSTLVFGLLAHLYCWTNALYSHDSLLIVQDWHVQVGFGRFSQWLYLAIRGPIVAPWLIGSLGLLFLSIGNALVVDLLGIRRRCFIVLICGALTTSATVTLVNATYLSWFDCFMLAYALSVLAIKTTMRFRLGFLWGTLLLCLSEGLYQSYLTTALTLAALFCIKLLLNSSASVPPKIAGRLGATIAGGTILYYLIAKAIQMVTGISDPNSYNSLSSALQFNSFREVADTLIQTWTLPLQYLLIPETYAGPVVGAVNVLLLAASLALLWKFSSSKRIPYTRPIEILILIGALPLCTNAICFIAAGTLHGLMIFSYSLWYLLPVLIFEAYLASNKSDALEGKTSPHRKSNSGSRRERALVSSPLFQLTFIICFILVLSNTIYANQVYTKKDLEYQSTLSAMTRLAERMDTTDGYVPGETPVVFLGSLAENKTYGARRVFPPQNLPDEHIYATGIKYTMSVTYPNTIRRYFEYVLGCPINLYDQADVMERISSDEKTSNIPPFPNQHCIRWIDDILVVRLS